MRRLAALALLLGAATLSARADDGTPPAPPPTPPPSAPAAPAPAPAVAVGAAVPQPPDVFAAALADAGLAPDALGFRGRGTWPRYPTTVPYRLPFFDDLLANPTETYEFTRTLGNSVEDLLTPASLTKASSKEAPSLYLLGLILGTDRRIGGARGFGVRLLEAKAPESDPLEGALEAIGARPADEGRLGRVADVPVAAQAALARLLLELQDAQAWTERGLRRVPRPMREAIFRALPELVENVPDGGKFTPEIEDAANAVDAQSLAYGGLKALGAVQVARVELAAAKPAEGWPKLTLRRETTLGTVIVTTEETSIVTAEAPFCLVSLAGRPAVERAGATTARRSMSVALFLEGASSLGSPEEGSDLRSAPSAGVACGVCGVGIVYGAGTSKTLYQARAWGLGAALFGTGVLLDEGGDDVYRLRNVGQGAAMFGAGLLLDAAGDDRYELLEGDGQGFGGPGGVGVLADRSGNDGYVVEARADRAGRPDYHSDGKIAGSNAQGAGMGRRGDMGDGHAWAGGLGALIDVDGNDRYDAGNFSQGVGYWFGTGLLYDGGGDDVYRSVYFSHASGAHFAVGCVVDEGGDDVHSLSDFPGVGLGPKAGAGIGFGWDVVNALLFERAGNDRYEADIISLGCANVRSNGWLLDEGGDDTYLAAEAAAAFGAIDERPEYATPGRKGAFPFHLPQLGLCLDLGGTDRWLRRPPGGGDPVADGRAGDGRAWGTVGARGPGGGANVAVGRDVASGRLGFLDAWPRRVAAKDPTATGAGTVPTK